jgi:hypothetical protein
LVLTALVILLAASLADLNAKPPAVTYAGGDGSSLEKAIVVKAQSEMFGVTAEYDYLAKHYPGYQRDAQHVERHKGKSFDVLNVTTKDKKKHVFYFDITSFYGKL